MPEIVVPARARPLAHGRGNSASKRKSACRFLLFRPLALRDGLVASLTNPKGLIFLLAFLPQFVDPTAGSVTLQLLLLGGIMKLSALVIEGSVALASGFVGGWLARRPNFIVWQERVAGIVMLGLGLRLALMRDLRGAK